MATLAPTSALSRNLASLGERNADLVEIIEAAAPRLDVTFDDTPQGVPSVSVAGAALCSRHRPVEEAARLSERVDVVENAVVVVLGFGAGYHVQQLARRLDGSGLIIIFEPDVRLLRTVLERIDHSSWLRSAMVVFITDPEDRGALAGRLQDADSIIAQGVAFLEHPPSRLRLSLQSARFSALFGEFVKAVKTSFVTTLMRSVDTVRNLLLNIDHYSAGAGITELQDAARGRPAVVVSAGPSLRRNMHLLAEPSVRQRCVIIATQTTVRPLLLAGIRPHFVTALDYHEISRRFYDDLTAEVVGDMTLIADPKAHPVILDAFPGPVRCCANRFLDDLLDDRKRPLGQLPGGATVAHLAVYVARYLGCDPIVLIGQDLAFSDGLYYAPGTAIDEVWAPELNPFNTIEMMEWQRIVRHRTHLSTARDVHGKPVFTDTQMLTYLQQFERDFARYEKEGVRIIDATEGGLPKQHTTAMRLAEVLDRYATEALPPLPVPDRRLDPGRLQAARERLEALRRDIGALEITSRRAASVIRDMFADQDDRAKMSAHFKKIERFRKEVEDRFAAFEILNHLNQLGVYKRFKADRRIHMVGGLEPRARQRAQLERDLESVTWIGDAAHEMTRQLSQARRVLAGEAVAVQPQSSSSLAEVVTVRSAAPPSRIAALVPVDPDRNGMGVARTLTATFAGRPVLQATLERLGASATLESIVLIAPRGFDVEAIIDRNRIGRPVIVERCDGSPYGPQQPAIAAARRWSDTSWRGGVAGVSVYDEVLCPTVSTEIMRRRGLTAAVVAGPDWPLLDVSAETGLEAIITRHLELPGQHNLVFSQAPPGLGVCLVSARLMEELALRNRLSTIGGLLVYQPHAPQPDPIARRANVQIDPRVSRSRIRATFDAPRYSGRLEAAFETLETAKVVEAIERARAETPDSLPKHVVVELCAERHGRPPMTLALAERLFGELAVAGDAVVTLAGRGDPLLHPDFDRIVGLAADSGLLGVHVRSELLCDELVLDRLLACRPDVVSVDLHAAGRETYRRVMGADRFDDVVANIDYLVTNRPRLSDHAPTAALALPWIVPRLQRRAETCQDIDPFFERWQRSLGTAVIEAACVPGDTLLPAETPARVLADEARRTMTVLCDGNVAAGDGSAGNVADSPVAELWRAVQSGTTGAIAARSKNHCR